MAISNLPTIQNQISLGNRTERINRIDRQIAINNKQIASLESQITTQKEVSTTIRETLSNNTDSINLTKKIISNNEKIIDLKNQQIKNNENSISILKQMISINEKMMASSKEMMGISKKIIDNNEKMIAIYEKMIAIMTKSPKKYSELDNRQLQKLPEVVETKKNLLEVSMNKLKDYPKQEHVALNEIAVKIVDKTFDGLNLNDLSANKDMFSNLSKNLDLAFRKHFMDKNYNLSMLSLKSYFKTYEQPSFKNIWI
jgi:chromosome segregation ATPase